MLVNIKVHVSQILYKLTVVNYLYLTALLPACWPCWPYAKGPPHTVRPPALFTPVHTRAACVCSAVNSARAPTAGEKLLPTAWSCVLCPMKRETHIFSAPGFHCSLQLSTSHVPSVLPDLLCKSSEGSIKAQNYLCNAHSKFSFVPHETRNLHVQFP